MQLVNRTPFAAKNALLFNKDGIETLYTIVNASLTIDAHWTLADEQRVPQTQDVYWGEPGESSIKYVTDLHPGKAATDIVVLGHACATDLKPVSALDVDITVGKVQKSLRIFGDRQWHKGAITQPETFTTLPLIYENAFGGQYSIDGKLHGLESRNPVGKGYRGSRSDSEMDGRALPNIEDAKVLIRSPSDTPEPAAVGFRAPNWHPRTQFSGTYDKHWQTSLAPCLPKDYDQRFQNAAHPDLIYPGFVSGGEPVAITHMHPSGSLQFTLPYIMLEGHVRGSKQARRPLKFLVESVIIEPNKLLLHLVWKAASVPVLHTIPDVIVDIGLLEYR